MSLVQSSPVVTSSTAATIGTVRTQSSYGRAWMFAVTTATVRGTVCRRPTSGSSDWMSAGPAPNEASAAWACWSSSRVTWGCATHVGATTHVNRRAERRAASQSAPHGFEPGATSATARTSAPTSTTTSSGSSSPLAMSRC
ncbi:MAG: hypothetical protein ACLQVI_23315, partial [Polyangiaceae bacterium]